MITAERINHLTPAQRQLLLERLQIAGDAAPEKELVAYVVSPAGRKLSAESLQAHCRSRLPDFMVPSRVVELPSLPRHPNGKVNRAVLPALDAEADLQPTVSTETKFENETESKVAQIWSDLLRVETVGRTDNFFRLGGHSLLALQVMARVREMFKANLPLKVLFNAPTVEGLASAILKASSAPCRSIPRIARRSDSDAITVQT